MLTDVWDWICDNIDGIIILLVILCFAAFCTFVLIESMPQMTEGIVVGKDHTPSSWRGAMIYTGKTMVPVQQYHPARWSIQVRGVTQDGKERTEWWEVTEAEWMRLEIGDGVMRHD